MERLSKEWLAEVLRLINVARAALGLQVLTEIPQGRRRDAHVCPLARALSRGLMHPVNVTRINVSFDDPEQARKVAAVWDTYIGVQSVDLPDVLREFVESFDRDDDALKQFEEPTNLEEDGA